MIAIPALALSWGAWCAWAAGRWALVRAAGLSGAFDWAKGRTAQALGGTGGQALGLAVVAGVIIVALGLALWWLRADAARDAQAPLRAAIAAGNAEAQATAAELARRSREAADQARAEADALREAAGERIAALEQALAAARAAGTLTTCVIPRDVVRQMRRRRQ